MGYTTRQVRCGDVLIGGGAPVSIQSMTNTDTRDVDATVEQIARLTDAGCQIIRCAVPDEEAAEALGRIKKRIRLPLVADIHFDYRLALSAIRNGADKVRINPGNIGSEDRVLAVLSAAAERGIPIRVGVNSGSLEKPLLEKYGGVCAEALAESALHMAEFVEERGFHDVVLSLKSSQVAMNYKAHKILREKTDLPFHIGITESGTARSGKLKSAVGIGALLLEGIGDTLRVSLTGDPVEEVRCAGEILAAAGLRKKAIEFVSCPTCGRTRVDLPAIAEEIENRLLPLALKREKEGKAPLTLAVMGCAVNGPGEAREADLGVACGKGEGLIFAKGEILHKVPEDQIADTLLRMIEEMK